MRRLFYAVLCVAGLGQAAFACQARYTVLEGDTPSSIAEKQLGNAARWSDIRDANPGLLGDLPVGQLLSIPCPTAQSAGPGPFLLAGRTAQITLIAGSNYAPFTARDWPEQGMLTELVNAALEESPHPVPHTIFWQDTWSEQLQRLEAKEYDMGFPWVRPDCDGKEASNPWCNSFHFSDPLIDVVTLLFVRTGDVFAFDNDADLQGRSLCRPAGYSTHDLDRPGRAWLSNRIITLHQPATPEDCFAMLVSGQVDAVAVNEFLGVQKMFELGLTDDVVPMPRPLSVDGLHVIISKTHWRGTAHLYRFNAGLAKLKQSDRYNAIVTRHLSLFWDRLKG